MWHLTASKISVSPSFLNWIKNEMIFYRNSELMLPTLIQQCNKKSFRFWSSSKLGDYQKFYRLSSTMIYDCIITIYQFIKPFFDKKLLFLRSMEPLNSPLKKI